MKRLTKTDQCLQASSLFQLDENQTSENMNTASFKNHDTEYMGWINPWDKCSHNIETNSLVCGANELTGFHKTELLRRYNKNIKIAS